MGGRTQYCHSWPEPKDCVVLTFPGNNIKTKYNSIRIQVGKLVSLMGVFTEHKGGTAFRSMFILNVLCQTQTTHLCLSTVTGFLE